MFEPDIRRLSIVPRWTTVPLNNKQNVAEHSFYVAVYTGQLVHWLNSWITVPTEELRAAPPIDLAVALQYALWHDALEVHSGDEPGPYKRKVSHGLVSETRIAMLKSSFGGEEWRVPEDVRIAMVVKVAEAMDEYMHLQNDVMSGNQVIDSIVADAHQRVKDAIRKLGLTFEKNDELFGICVGAMVTSHHYNYTCDR